jgi:tetratricopeptide (TPR) repeat protein
MTFDPKALGPSEVHAINAQASVLMKRGIRLLNETQPEAISEALDCFDRALELRRGLPIDSDPVLGYGLAACWLNRADALVRLGDPAQFPAALRAYDEGIGVMRGLPLGDDARFPRRLAMAHQNRGLALHTQGRSGAAEAIVAFTDAIAILDREEAALIPDRQYLLAVVWTNLANAHASEANAQSESLAREAAQRAIALVTDLEGDDKDAAEVGLKARHVLCHTIAGRLSQATSSQEPMPDDVHQATDAVDEGLTLARRWEQKGVARFRGVAYDLFRFGARVYAKYQPQFLNEFVLENMDPGRSSSEYVGSAEMRSAAQEALELSSGNDG